MSNPNNSNSNPVPQNNRRNQQQPGFQNEIVEDGNDFVDFDTGNEFSSSYNRDIMNAQMRAFSQSNNDRNNTILTNLQDNRIEGRFSYSNNPQLEVVHNQTQGVVGQINRTFVSQNSLGAILIGGGVGASSSGQGGEIQQNQSNAQQQYQSNGGTSNNQNNRSSSHQRANSQSLSFQQQIQPDILLQQINIQNYHQANSDQASKQQQQNLIQLQNSRKSATCSYHHKSYVAYCMMHKELMCEECCDLSHHKDHNTQILLLKAAAQNFLTDVDYQLNQLMLQKSNIANCEGFNLKNQIRKQIIEYFEQLKNQIDELQKNKLDEFNKLFKDTNLTNIKSKATELKQKIEAYERFLALKKIDFENRNYAHFLQKTQEIDKIVKLSEKLAKDASDLVKEKEQQKSIEFIQDRSRAEAKIKQVIEATLKVPVLKYNRDMLDTLHFFVYNTHNLFMYNFRSHSYRSYVVNIKIPANFMSVENEEGRIFLTGGGEPGKATKFCYEFVEERLVQKRDMLFERRAHTLTSVVVEGKRSQIFAIGSSLPNESMNKCEVYDVASDQWSQISNLNTKRNFHTTIAFENQFLYVVAGFNGGQRTNLIEKFDLKKRQYWETLNLRIKENTNWICLEGCGLFQISSQHILIFGGFTTSDQKTNHCYLFNVHSNEIEQLNCKTRTQSNFYQRQPKLGADGKLYCVETNLLDLHVFDMKTFEWDFIDRKFIGW